MQRLLGILTALVVASACASDASPALTRAAQSPQPTETTEPSPSPSPTPAFTDAPLDNFSKKKAMHHVRELAGDIGVRVRATPGEAAGARYIAGRFKALGYRVNIQRFSVDGGTSRNVVAWWPEAKRYPVVIGGHMDTVSGAPGANDNASGVAAILEVARLVAGKAPARWIRFVAFGAEERGADGTNHRGSETFVARLGEEGRAKLAAMVSVDMIADGRPLMVTHAGIGPDDFARYLYDVGVDIGVDMTYETTCDCSDNGPFELAGIPAGALWSGPEPNYHDASDTVANMVPDDLMRTGRVVRALVNRLDRALVRRFRRA